MKISGKKWAEINASILNDLNCTVVKEKDECIIFEKAEKKSFGWALNKVDTIELIGIRLDESYTVSKTLHWRLNCEKVGKTTGSTKEKTWKIWNDSHCFEKGNQIVC